MLQLLCKAHFCFKSAFDNYRSTRKTMGSKAYKQKFCFVDKLSNCWKEYYLGVADIVHQ